MLKKQTQPGALKPCLLSGEIKRNESINSQQTLLISLHATDMKTRGPIYCSAGPLVRPHVVRCTNRLAEQWCGTKFRGKV